MRGPNVMLGYYRDPVQTAAARAKWVGEALRQSEAQARDYARSVAWQPVAVAPLPAPPQPSAGGPAEPGNPQAQ